MNVNKPFLFSYEYIEHQYLNTIKLGYDFITCKEYVLRKGSQKLGKVVVNRVDIDLSLKKTERILEIFDRLNIKATFFLRLHAREYNPLSFENYRIIKNIVKAGHELGYHSEIIDGSVIWDEDPADILRRDINLLTSTFDAEIAGVASHGGATGLNNLDFWSDRSANEFGLLYEAYDTQPNFDLFNNSLYVSDSEWTRWKTYLYGELQLDNRNSLFDHAKSGHPLIYLLIHPDTYFDRHIYENEN